MSDSQWYFLKALTNLGEPCFYPKGRGMCQNVNKIEQPQTNILCPKNIKRLQGPPLIEIGLNKDKYK